VTVQNSLILSGLDSQRAGEARPQAITRIEKIDDVVSVASANLFYRHINVTPSIGEPT
jgi:hypothetical protein